MEQFNSYCEAVASGKLHAVHKEYHDKEYGFPIAEDSEFFARLVLELNQAGLSWETILKKKDGFYEAYDGFDIETVANYDKADRERLKNNPKIIRNRLKIDAAIHNANIILSLQREYGSFGAWLNLHHPLSKEKWVKLFKQHFKFTGGEITNEFLMSTGYLKGAHIKTCPTYHSVAKTNPPWLR